MRLLARITFNVLVAVGVYLGYKLICVEEIDTNIGLSKYSKGITIVDYIEPEKPDKIENDDNDSIKTTTKKLVKLCYILSILVKKKYYFLKTFLPLTPQCTFH